MVAGAFQGFEVETMTEGTSGGGVIGLSAEWSGAAVTGCTSLSSQGVAKCIASALTPGTLYSFRVRTLCHNAASSCWSATSDGSTLPEPASPPTGVSAGNAQDNSIDIQWTPGAPNQCSFTKHKDFTSRSFSESPVVVDGEDEGRLRGGQLTGVTNAARLKPGGTTTGDRPLTLYGNVKAAVRLLAEGSHEFASFFSWIPVRRERCG